MEYISTKDAAKKWGISQRRVAKLCSENRIQNATMIGNIWLIPSSAEKPNDARTNRYIEDSNSKIKPFLKWAGGKGQLINEIQEYYPFENSNITKYAEPFVGGGAVLFDILSRYDLEDVYISDVNKELINSYIVIRDNVDEIISILTTLKNEYIPKNNEDRKKYFLEKRNKYNNLIVTTSSLGNIEKAALMIFLNKTCFNGLYRVNKKGLFNVPMGAYKNPEIFEENNLIAISKKLENVKIECADYRNSKTFIDKKTFVYFDPPYRPLTETASFTSYSNYDFNDESQKELAEFIDEIHNKGAMILASNSDPKNINPDDNFFDILYSNYNIKRVEANRMINSKSNSRGKIKELLISNF